MIPKSEKNVPNEHKMYQMIINYSKKTCAIFQMAKNISTFSNLRPSKIYPKSDFWFENKPSGNPAPRMPESRVLTKQKQRERLAKKKKSDRQN
jgi:hypothetical protein